MMIGSAWVISEMSWTGCRLLTAESGRGCMEKATALFFNATRSVVSTCRLYPVVKKIFTVELALILWNSLKLAAKAIVVNSLNFVSSSIPYYLFAWFGQFWKLTQRGSIGTVLLDYWSQGIIFEMTLRRYFWVPNRSTKELLIRRPFWWCNHDVGLQLFMAFLIVLG